MLPTMSGGSDSTALGGGAELGQVLAEYVWLGTAGTLRSKTRVLEAGLPACVEELPIMVVSDCEGLHHSQSSESFSATDIVLRPRKMFKDPFRGGEHVLVLCDPYMAPSQVDLSSPSPQPQPVLQPHASNMRAPCEQLMAQAQVEQPLFAVEQEYFVEQEDEYCMSPQEEPHGFWPHAHLPDPSKPHLYGPMGELTQTIPAVRGASMARAAAARKLSEAHLHCCLKAGLKVTSCGEGGQAGMWSYKLGPMPGTELGDQLWMSRHLLIRLAEAMCVPLSFDAKAAGRPISCFVKYSTLSSRRPDIGLSVLQQHLGRLQASHVQHMLAYGLPKSPDPAAAAAAAAVAPACAVCSSSAAPLCIPVSTVLHRCGHIVDRRPIANADPWVVAMRLVSTTLGVPLPTSTQITPVPVAAYASGPCSNGSCDSQTALAAEVVVNAIQAAQYAALANALQRTAPIAHQQQPQQHPACMMMRPSLLAQQLVCEAAVQQQLVSGCCSENEEGVSGDSWACDSVPEQGSLCTEDVLLQELDRMDGYLPAEPMHVAAEASCCESCCSDGTSPETTLEEEDACSQPSASPAKQQPGRAKRSRTGTCNTSACDGSFSCAALMMPRHMVPLHV